MNRSIQGTYERVLHLDRKGTNTDARTVPASLSSETEVARWFGTEVLSHEPGAVDLSRADGNGLPMLFGHDHKTLIGRVRDVRLDNGKLRGTLHFSPNSVEADRAWADVRDGFLTDISIGYRINKWEQEDGNDLVRVTSWQVYEASVVSVPADQNVGINRQMENQTMTDKHDGQTGGTHDGPGVVDFDSAIKRGKQIGAEETRQAERTRLMEIDQAFSLGSVPKTTEMQALRSTAIEQGWSIDKVNRELLERIGGDGEPATDHRAYTDTSQGMSQHTGQPKPTGQPNHVSAGRDNLDSYREIAQKGLEVRCGLIKDNAEKRKVIDSGYAGMTLLDLARDYLYTLNVDMRGLRPDELVGRAFITRASGMTTSDFTNLLGNVANKSLLMGWDEIPETWRQVSRVGSLPDFKIADRPGMSHFSDLDEVPDDGDISYGSFTDYKEQIQLVEYAKKFRLSRKTIINDDLNAFSRIPRLGGRAASRKVGDKVWDTLVSNSHVGPTLNQDSVALFNAAHSNYVASGSGAAPSVTTLNTGFSAMGTQTDPSGNAALNISPRFLLVPKALEVTANILANAEFDPIGNTNAKGGARQPNPFRGRLEVVPEARLELSAHGNLATGWYLAADPDMYDTVEVAFLNGVSEPYMREEEEWDTRGVEYVFGIDCGVAYLDFRGLYFNYGA